MADGIPKVPGSELLGRSLDELCAVAREVGLPAYAGTQMARWIYARGTASFDLMTDLPRRVRRDLATRHDIGIRPPARCVVSADGTRKYLFGGNAGGWVETVWIPDRGRSTLCVSTQAGCRMGCRFCHTARQRFAGHLSAGAMLNQLTGLPERPAVDNVVFMGMGEPLDNLDEVLRALRAMSADWGLAMSPRRLTVSTVGLLPAMDRLLQESECHVAISLHSPFSEERASLMPVERTHPIREVVARLRRYEWRGQRRLMFEYIVFGGFNDTPRHVRELCRLLHGLPCRINLMRYHPRPDQRWPATEEGRLLAFETALRAKGFRTTIRRSRGQDIAAACGQLSTLAVVEDEPPPSSRSGMIVGHGGSSGGTVA